MKINQTFGRNHPYDRVFLYCKVLHTVAFNSNTARSRLVMYSGIDCTNFGRIADYLCLVGFLREVPLVKGQRREHKQKRGTFAVTTKGLSWLRRAEQVLDEVPYKTQEEVSQAKESQAKVKAQMRGQVTVMEV